MTVVTMYDYGMTSTLSISIWWYCYLLIMRAGDMTIIRDDGIRIHFTSVRYLFLFFGIFMLCRLSHWYSVLVILTWCRDRCLFIDKLWWRLYIQYGRKLTKRRHPWPTDIYGIYILLNIVLCWYLFCSVFIPILPFTYAWYSSTMRVPFACGILLTCKHKPPDACLLIRQ